MNETSRGLEITPLEFSDEINSTFKKISSVFYAKFYATIGMRSNKPFSMPYSKSGGIERKRDRREKEEKNIYSQLP